MRNLWTELLAQTRYRAFGDFHQAVGRHGRGSVGGRETEMGMVQAREVTAQVRVLRPPRRKIDGRTRFESLAEKDEGFVVVVGLWYDCVHTTYQVLPWGSCVPK